MTTKERGTLTSLAGELQPHPCVHVAHAYAQQRLCSQSEWGATVDEEAKKQQA